MSSYAESVLQPGEKIVVTGRLHWIIYGWSIVYLACGAAAVLIEFFYAPEERWLIRWTTIAFGAMFIVTFLYAWFIRWITEFAVTNRRVISSRIFIKRDTEEMNMDKVETVDISQTIPGRLLDYGTIRIMGTGGTNDITVEKVAAPYSLRSAITAR